jgi:hypothetical protein
MTVIAAFVSTLVPPLAGDVLVTVGGVVSAVLSSGVLLLLQAASVNATTASNAVMTCGLRDLMSLLLGAGELDGYYRLSTGARFTQRFSANKTFETRV